MNPDILGRLHEITIKELGMTSELQEMAAYNGPMRGALRERILERIQNRKDLEFKVEMVKQRNNEDLSKWKNGFAPIPEIPEPQPPLQRSIKV